MSNGVIFGRSGMCNRFLHDLNYVTRCLAHIVNLATQALITTRSKSKHYNPHELDEHIPDVDAFERDEIGLVRSIVVKVSHFTVMLLKEDNILKTLKERSSSQRKQLFKSVQMRAGVNPVQLLLDMKVRWSSTHVMLKRILSRRSVSTTFQIVSNDNLINSLQCVDTFVYEMGCIAGRESIEKRRKIDSLRLAAGEWERVKTFEKLLAVSTLVYNSVF